MFKPGVPSSFFVREIKSWIFFCFLCVIIRSLWDKFVSFRFTLAIKKKMAYFFVVVVVSFVFGAITIVLRVITTGKLRKHISRGGKKKGAGERYGNIKINCLTLCFYQFPVSPLPSPHFPPPLFFFCPLPHFRRIPPFWRGINSTAAL